MSKKSDSPSRDSDSGRQSQEASGQYSFFPPSSVFVMPPRIGGGPMRMFQRGNPGANRFPHSADFTRFPNVGHQFRSSYGTAAASQQSVNRQPTNTFPDSLLFNQSYLPIQQQPHSSTEIPSVLRNLFQTSADLFRMRNPGPIPASHMPRQTPCEDPNQLPNKSTSSNPTYGSRNMFASALGTFSQINEQAMQQLQQQQQVFPFSSPHGSLRNPMGIPFPQNHQKHKLVFDVNTPKTKTALSHSARHHPYAASSSYSDQDAPCSSKSVPSGHHETSHNFQYHQHGATENLNGGSSKLPRTPGNQDSLLEELKICKMWLEKLFIWCRGSGILPCPEEFDFPLKNLSEKVTDYTKRIARILGKNYNYIHFQTFTSLFIIFPECPEGLQSAPFIAREIIKVIDRVYNSEMDRATEIVLNMYTRSIVYVPQPEREAVYFMLMPSYLLIAAERTYDGLYENSQKVVTSMVNFLKKNPTSILKSRMLIFCKLVFIRMKPDRESNFSIYEKISVMVSDFLIPDSEKAKLNLILQDLGVKHAMVMDEQRYLRHYQLLYKDSKKVLNIMNASKENLTKLFV